MTNSILPFGSKSIFIPRLIPGTFSSVNKWTPSKLKPYLVMWLSSDNGVLETNSLVSSWNDRGPNGNNLTNSTVLPFRF